MSKLVYARRSDTHTTPQMHVAHTQQGDVAGDGGTLYKLKGKGPRFWAKADLEKKGFTDLAHEYYLMYEFDTGKSAEYPNLPSLAKGKQTTSPCFATWEVLMEKKE